MEQSFRTVFSIPKADFDIAYQDQILAIGSCFAENIAKYLKKGRFHTEINPFGILYNPVSIAESLAFLWNDDILPESNIVQEGELWHSFLHHGSFSQLSLDTLKSNLEESLKIHRTFAKKTTRLLITLGTANVFIYKKSGKIVANCHKIPNTQFEKKRLTVQECVENLATVLQSIQQKNPTIEVILTVSPIRHIRDGFVENQRSKATLLLAAELLEQQFPFVHYFPAYELVMDDLRDYRFFNADMIHPNEQAIEYVWKAFAKKYFTSETSSIYEQIEQLNLAAAHRPLFPESSEYQLFLQKQITKKQALKQQYPNLNWNDNHFEN